MKHVAAYMLARLGGVEQPASGDVQKILQSVGIESENSQLEQLISAVSGKNVDELISAGMSKLASMPAGVAVASAPSAGAAPAAAAAAEAPKKVEKEESDEDMGFGLFD